MLNHSRRKKDTKSIIGPAGVRAILKAMVEAGHGAVPTVCIGGINTDNAAKVLAQTSAAPAKSLDGVAVVSAVIAAEDPAEAARHLAGHVAVAAIPLVVGAVGRTTPLSHNMTNLASFRAFFLVLVLVLFSYGLMGDAI